MQLLLPELGLFVWTLLAFLIVFFILKKFAWKPILNMLHERETNIANSIASAEKMKAEMNQMQAENETLLAKAREERSAILKEAKEAKDKMIQEAKEKAKEEAAKIMADANIQIEQSKNRAMTEVKNQIGMLTVGVAEKVLRKKLSDDAAQNQYINELVDDITLN